MWGEQLLSWFWSLNWEIREKKQSLRVQTLSSGHWFGLQDGSCDARGSNIQYLLPSVPNFVFLRQRLSLNWKLSESAILAAQQASGILLSPPPSSRITCTHHHTQVFKVGTGD